MNNFPTGSQLPLWSFKFKSGSRVETITRNEIEAKLISKALKEEAFKSLLLSNPHLAICQLFDIEVAQDLKIEVVEETSSVIYLVLPNNPYAGLSENELVSSLGMNLLQVAELVLNQQKGLAPENKQKNVEMVAKAWKDNSYKKLLLADPALVLKEELDEEVGKGVEVVVLEETADKIFLVIPESIEAVLEEKVVDTQFLNLEMLVGSHLFTDEPNAANCAFLNNTANAFLCQANQDYTHNGAPGC